MLRPTRFTPRAVTLTTPFAVFATAPTELDAAEAVCPKGLQRRPINPLERFLRVGAIFLQSKNVLFSSTFEDYREYPSMRIDFLK